MRILRPRLELLSSLLVATAPLALAMQPSSAAAQSALRFNGTSQYVTFGRADSLNATRFTIECWFRREGTGATTSTGTGGVTAIPLLTKGRGEAEGSNVDMNWFLGIRGTDGVLCADYEEGTGQTSPGLNHPIAGTTRISMNTWHHGAVTFDGTSLALYLNGDLEATVAVGSNRLPQSLSIQHAALASAQTSTGAAQGFFQGTIDEARVWRRARSQQAIRDSLGLEITSAPGLRGRWGLNENAGSTATNSVATGPNGNLVATPLWVTGTTFQTPNALGFAGTNDFVTFGNAAPLGLAAFTVECWFRRDATGVTTDTGAGGMFAIPLVTKGRAETDDSNVDMNWFLGIRGSDNKLAADFEEGASGTDPGLNHPIAGTTTIALNTWYHAAATYDGTTWRLYLNGGLEATLNVGEPPQSASIQHAGLGTGLNSTGVAQGFFAGVLDEVRVWNHARSQPEIISTINTAIETAQSGLLARWSLDEASGAMAGGSAGTAVNGTLNGTGWGWVAGAPFNAIPPTPPTVPISLTATAISHAQVDLAWSDQSNNETGFEIERSTSGLGGPFAPLATVGANVQAYSDLTVAASLEHCYRVRSVNGQGASAWTDPSCATTPAEGASALDFAGTNGYVTFGQAPGLGLEAFTLECWFRRDSTGTGTDTGTDGIQLAVPLVAKGRGETDVGTVDLNYFLGIDRDTHVLVADFEEGPEGVSPGRNHPVFGVTTIGNGIWHHAAATYDGSTWRLYLDGQLETTLSVGQPVQSASDQHASIGSALDTAGAPEGFFDGVIDEARIWDGARTLSQIRTTLNAQITAPTSGLIARWGLNEGTGTGVQSGAGGTVHGTLQGTGWSWVTPGAPFDLVINDPPSLPQIQAPPDDATGVSTSPMLEVVVTDPEGDTMDVTFYGRPVPVVQPNDFTIVPLPDTQYYTGALNGGTPAIMESQMNWIVANRASRNIVYVPQLGDCTEHGDNNGNPIQWQRADAAFSILENPLTTGLDDGIPYGIAVGNHDQSPAGDAAGTTIFYNQFFGEARFTGRDYYGGHYGGNNDNHFDLFSASGLDFIAIHFEYDTVPDAPVVAWGESLLTAHSTRRAIVVSHYLMNEGEQASFGSQGQALYTALQDHPNLFLMLCGHVSEEGKRTDVFAGNTVFTLLSDYQGRTNGGNGWLRILTFSPANNTIQVQTYSPWLNSFESDASSQFTLPYSMTNEAGFMLIGTDEDVPDGGTASVPWPKLAPNTAYEWYAIASDAEGETQSATFQFTTSNTFTIVASASSGGAIFPTGSVNVTAGANQLFTITPDPGYAIADVLVDGNSVGAVTEYTFTTVDEAHTIAASFVDAAGPEVAVTSPNGAELLSVYAATTITWSADDVSGVADVDVELSRSGPGGPWETLAAAIPNTGSFDWTPTGPATVDAYVRIVARDALANVANDASDAAFEISESVTSVGDGPVTALALGVPAPNPSRDHTRFAFALPEAGPVRLRVLDVRGRQVAQLVNDVRRPGRYALSWNGTTARGRVPAGVYLVELDAGGKRMVRRLTIVH